MKRSWQYNIKQALSGREASLACLVIAIAGRITQLIYFFNIRLDASHQVIATKNLVNGHGISMGKAYASDISATIYEPLINWPPGYSLLQAPFFALFNGNYVAAGLTLGILFSIILILVSRSILRLLDIPVYLINISTLIAGFFIYYFYFIASSDAIAISLVMTGVYYCLALLKSTDRWLKKTLGIILSLLLCGALKYLFLPVVLVIPVYIGWRGVVEKNKLLIRSGLLSIISLVLILGAILAWQKSISGSATYISEPGRGFFPEHLLSFFPFIPGSFIKPDSILMILPANSLASSYLYILLQSIHLVIFFLISFFLLRKLMRTGVKNVPLHDNFTDLTLFISWAITLLLALLSIQVEKEKWQGGHLWTYIEEQRYYGLPIVMIQLLVLVFYHHNRSQLSRIVKFFLYLVFFLLAIETARGMLFVANRVIKFNKEEYSWQSELKLQRYADDLVKSTLKKQPAEHIVVGGPFYYINHRVSLYSDAALLNDPALLNATGSLNAKKTTLLLVILRKEDMEEYSAFLNSGVQLAGQYGGLYFYTVYVNP